MLTNTVFDKNLAVAGDLNGPAFNVAGGAFVLGAFGTFGGGTVKLQWTSDADTTWIDIGPQNAVPTLLTAAGTTSFNLPPGRFRVVVTGSTAPALLYWFGWANQG